MRLYVWVVSARFGGKWAFVHAYPTFGAAKAAMDRLFAEQLGIEKIRATKYVPMKGVK